MLLKIDLSKKQEIIVEGKITGISSRPKNDGSLYAMFTFTEKDGDITNVKCWDYDKVNQLEGKVVKAKVECSLYNGSNSFVLKEMGKVLEDAEINEEDYLVKRYELQHLKGWLNDIVKDTNNFTENFKPLVMKFLNLPVIKDRFLKEYAARTHHDACLHGLLAHTIKNMKFAMVIINTYEHLFNSNKEKDIFMLGLLIHDIGKVITRRYTTINEDEIVLEHRTLGLKYFLLNEGKEFFLSVEEIYGKQAIVELEAIIMQHHGAFEERPKTVFSYLAHLVDMLDTNITGVEEAVYIQKQQELPDRKYINGINGSVTEKTAFVKLRLQNLG